MPTLAIVGLQWGDEGKGKIVDLLSSEAELVVRSQGGNNAGHTVVIDGIEYYLHIIPSGIIRADVECLIGGGVVFDPKAFFQELDQLEGKGISCDGRLRISPYAHVIFPYHRLLDQIDEKKKGVDAIGTTGRGIGPCYSDSIARVGIRIADLLVPEVLRKKLELNLSLKNPLLECPLEITSIYDEYLGYAEKLRPFVYPVESYLYQAIQRGKKVIFEGAQGALLDILYGTYPFVTSSHTTSGGLALGAGLGPNAIEQTLGVIKAYATRVGQGPFPTEDPFLDPRSAREFGTTTGRQRRVGWFDAVLATYALRLNGAKMVALTKLDVLDYLPKIRICTAYRLDGKVIKEPPPRIEDLERVEPVYEELEGWKTETKEINRLEEFPKNARIFLNMLESLLGTQIVIVSYGPERDKTWKRKNFF